MARWNGIAVVALMILTGCASAPTKTMRLRDFIAHDQMVLDADRSLIEQDGTKEWPNGGEITLRNKFLEIKYSLMTENGYGKLLTKVRILDEWYDDFQHTEVHQVSLGVLVPQERYSVRYKTRKDGGEVFWGEWEVLHKGETKVFCWLGFSPGAEPAILQAFERNSYGILVPIRADSLKSFQKKNQLHGMP